MMTISQDSFLFTSNWFKSLTVKTGFLITMILMFMPGVSFAGDPDEIFVEAVERSDERTGVYTRVWPWPPYGMPYYTKGEYKLKYDSANNWCLTKGGAPECLAISSESGVNRPWRTSYSQGISVYVDKSNRWGDIYTISSSYYANSSSDMPVRLHLVADDSRTAMFQSISAFEDFDHQPQNAEWQIIPVTSNSEHYVIISIFNRKYLTIDSSGEVILRNYSCELWNESCQLNPLDERAQWRFEIMSDKNDFVLINKHKIFSKERVLKIRTENDGSIVATTAFINEENNFDETILFNLDERFINMTIYPDEDFVNQRGRMHLANGLVVGKLFTPSPDPRNSTLSRIIRRFKVTIAHRGGSSYEFVPHIGDPSNPEYEAHLNGLLDQMLDPTARIPADSQLSRDELRNILNCQLSNAYNSLGIYSEGLIWIPDAPIDGQCTLNTLDAFDRTGTLQLSFLSRIEARDGDTLNELNGGQVLKIITSVACDNDPNYENCQAEDYFGFLIKETASDGTVSYKIDDPTQSSGYTPP